MAPIFSALHPMRTVMQQGTARASPHKTALLHVPLIFASRIFYLVGRDPLLTLHFLMRLAFVIFTFQRRGITSQMLALLYQMTYLSLIAACGTTCLNGIVRRMCESFHLFSRILLLCSFLVHATPRSCSTYVTHRLGMSLSGSLGSSSDVFEFSSSHLSIT